MTPYLQDTDLTVYQGDALATLRELPSESVHMCVTSPPFYSLRDYGVDGQIGLEASPQEWCDSLVDVFREVRRVLRPDGTLWVEVGDSYASNPAKGGSGTYNGRNGYGEGYDRSKRQLGGLKEKDMCGAPWLLAFALRADGWYLRSDIIWARPNPMPESVTDRPTKAHSYLFMLSRSPRYFYDADAIREPATHGERFHGGYEASHNGYASRNGRDGTPNLTTARNKRSVWTIPTQPLADEHYAAYPEALVEPCILAGTSERGVCPECGAPWVREVESESSWAERKVNGATRGNLAHGENVGAGTQRGVHATGVSHDLDAKRRETTGWRPTCVCTRSDLEELAGASVGSPTRAVDDRRPSDRSRDALTPVPAVVLDPFLGSGTTALVARRLGRRCVGIELNADYCRMIARRTQQLSLVAEATA